MTEAAILNIIRIRGTFQVNPFSYRDAKVRKTLRVMVKQRKIVRVRTSAGLHNYVLPEKPCAQPSSQQP